MKLADVGGSCTSTKSIKLKDLKDQNGNQFDLSPSSDTGKNLMIDPRPIFYDRRGYKFNIEVRSSTLIITRTDKNEGWGSDACSGGFYFRAYDRTKEDIPPVFDSSVPYIYWGLNYECAPYDTVEAKVHRTVTEIKYYAFYCCKKMVICDMSNAPVKMIFKAFKECTSLRTILFSQQLKNIGLQAFDGCSAIEILVLPPKVKFIGYKAFANCSNIQMVVIPPGASRCISGLAFQNCKMMRVLQLPDAFLKFPHTMDLKNVTNNFIDDCDALHAIIPNDVIPKQWLRNRYNNFPLHKVCYSVKVTIDDIEKCTQNHPNSASLSDEIGMTALHIISMRAGTLISRASTSQQDPKQQGHSRTVIIKHNANVLGLIMACFKANMSAAFVKDDTGKTPLDYLLKYCNNLDLHNCMVTSFCMHWLRIMEEH